MEPRTNKYLIVALLLGIAFHGTSMFFTLESTYDALIHVFFGNHYANSWFEPWNYNWYTGFSVMGYPPLVHQTIALLSLVGGLKFGMFTVAIIGVILFITGVYRFSLLLTADRKVAGYAAIIAVFSSSFVETLHLFGQLPSVIGISVLLHALPEIYLWLRTGKYRYLLTSFSLLAVTVTSHHVTPIFGMVFFVFPLIGLVLMDACRKSVASYREITLLHFVKTFAGHLKRIVTFGFGSLVLIIVCILPYWINSKNNPITQVPIPHGSRDNFLEVTSSGLVFFLVPWGILLFFLPYIFYRYFSKRYLFFGLSFTLLLILGTGGTTPLPLKILGESAFNILTLDRFTLWATIMALPIFGELIFRFAEGDLKEQMRSRFGSVFYRLTGGLLAAMFISMSVFTTSLSYFRPAQPETIDMLPIVNFLNQDQHDKWRYLPLGFGDQMAWLSAQTNASTVDGNYHSARRLPELTTKAVERLENSKFRGVEGIGSLQQFLTVPEKYHLKYIFSNDKFYDPILYFTGWHRLGRLENGIMVWEREGVSPLPSVLPKEDVPRFQKLMWGIIPMLTVIIALFILLRKLWLRTAKSRENAKCEYLEFKNDYHKFNRKVRVINQLWFSVLILTLFFGIVSFYLNNSSQISPTNVVKAYYDALDFKEFEKAHSFINPKNNKDLSQFMLEISVSDGLLSSYAKLDAIDVSVISENDSVAKSMVSTKWVTPLETYNKSVIHELEKYNGKWYLQSTDIDLDIPPDQLISENSTVFYNHGRRRITSEQTYHEDVLKQPVVEVISATLIQLDNRYTIIGELQNVDNVPADISIKGSLYSKTNVQIATQNAKDIVKHKLLPKEATCFRIDFENKALFSNTMRAETNNDLTELSALNLNDPPATFELQIEANVATTDLVDNLAINSLSVENSEVNGSLFNKGIEDATIPQMLISYYDDDRALVWVEKKYIDKSVRPQRKRRFSFQLIDLEGLKPLESSLENVYINGEHNDEIRRKNVPDRIYSQANKLQFQNDTKDTYYFQVKLNSYTGNPKE